jgi:hypothetical protein
MYSIYICYPMRSSPGEGKKWREKIATLKPNRTWGRIARGYSCSGWQELERPLRYFARGPEYTISGGWRRGKKKPWFTAQATLRGGEAIFSS